MNKPRESDRRKTDHDNGGQSHDILSSMIETDRNILSENRSAPDFRGDVSLAQPRGPVLDPESCQRLQEICASKAIAAVESERGAVLTLDKGRCIMCGMCLRQAPSTFNIQASFALPARTLKGLIVAQLPDSSENHTKLKSDEIGKQLREKITRTLGRSLAVREVDAGSCNGCEVEVSALSNPIYDVERFGVHFVASPRHADVLLVTGVASRNMELALKMTYDATPDPKVVVAAGACACTGGLFGDTYATSGGITRVVPVDVFVPGCPPRPEALLHGLLLAVDRIP